MECADILPRVELLRKCSEAVENSKTLLESIASFLKSSVARYPRALSSREPVRGNGEPRFTA
jgi:hypothetical protein